MAEELPVTNPIRLRVALSLSQFYLEILGSPEEAIQTAKNAFDAALPQIDGLSEEDYDEATLLLQLLRDNLTLWTPDMEEEGMFCDGTL